MVEKEQQLDLKIQEVPALHSDLEKVKLEKGRESQLLKEQVAQLAKDKKPLEERNKSLQQKNKLIVKNHKGKFLSLCFLDCRVVE